MNIKPIRQKQVARLVEEALTKALREKALRASSLKLWHDFATRTDLVRTRKPAIWAAAVLYTMERLRGEPISQEDAGRLFKVSAFSVSKKHRQIAEALDLRWLDDRYLDADDLEALRSEEDDLLEGMSLLDVQARWNSPPLPFIDDQTWTEAHDLIIEGRCALEHDPIKARRLFEDSINLIPHLGDAYNGLAALANNCGDIARAEECYRKAYEMEAGLLGNESTDGYYWWQELETRPYMRARCGLGWIFLRTERYDEALNEFTTLLRLNPDDNQGVRRAIAPLHQLNGDLTSALEAYREHERCYPENMIDPHFSLCRGLALYAAGDHRNAVAYLRQILFENIYLMPLVAGAPLPPTDHWHASNLHEPAYAHDYLDIYGRLWQRTPNARAVLDRLWRDPEVVADVDAWLELGRRIEAGKEGNSFSKAQTKARWLALIAARGSIEERKLSPAAVSRILGIPESAR